MKIHLWNAYNPKKISVNVKDKFKNRIKKDIENNIYKIARELKITPARLYEYFIYQDSPIPLTTLIKICKIIRISLMEMEINIIMYKHMFVPNKNSIKDPKLPLKISPYFTSIIANLYFDGSVPKDGKGTYYHQKKEEIMDDFINKIKSVFGDVQYSIRRDHRGVLKCRIPRIIGEICKSVYNIESFGTFDSRLSKFIFDLPKQHKIAFIITAILDEGSITYDGTIMFGVNNKELCEDVRILCNQIGLNTNRVRNTKNTDSYYFHIKSLNYFYDMYRKFSRNYPLISLNYKGERLRKALEIKRKKFYYTKTFADKRKNMILKNLKEERTINYLSSKYLIPPRTIRRYMYEWMKGGIVSRNKIGNEYVYFVLG